MLPVGLTNSKDDILNLREEGDNDQEKIAYALQIGG
jgi:hypothetical protein